MGKFNIDNLDKNVFVEKYFCNYIFSSFNLNGLIILKIYIL